MSITGEAADTSLLLPFLPFLSFLHRTRNLVNVTFLRRRESVSSIEGMVVSVTMPGPSTTPQQVAEQVQEKADQLADNNANSTDSDVRYMAYGARLRTALRAAQRYLAYVSCNCFYISPSGGKDAGVLTRWYT